MLARFRKEFGPLGIELLIFGYNFFQGGGFICLSSPMTVNMSFALFVIRNFVSSLMHFIMKKRSTPTKYDLT